MVYGVGVEFRLGVGVVVSEIGVWSRVGVVGGFGLGCVGLIFVF